MSLLSSIQMAGNALQANDIGLQVVGQNISNDSSTGYVREELLLSPGPTIRYGGLLMGSGVTVQGIIEDVDQFLEQRLRGATSDQANSAAVQDTYTQLETVLAALDTNSGLGATLTQFFNGISNVLNQPEDESVRNLTVQQGVTLAQSVNDVAQRVEQIRSDVNDQIAGMAHDVNRLTTQIADLNLQITNAEGGGTSASQAVGLRDQRQQDLLELSQNIGISTQEQPDGSVSVYCGGDYLVLGGHARPVNIQLTSNRGLSVAGINLVETNSPLQTTSGKLAGLTNARDSVLGGFLDDFNTFAGTLANEFNKVYASGQGLSGFSSMTGQNAVDDANASLSNAGLPFAPTNGSFQVLLHDTQTGVTQTSTVHVDLLGLGTDTTLASLRDQFNAIDGIRASINGSGQLVLKTSSAAQQFAFASDTSGALAALGLNTFFVGSNANDLAVNQDVIADPGKFAASQGGIGNDSLNAQQLANFGSQPLATQQGMSITDVFNRLSSNVSQASSTARAMATGDTTFATTLKNQSLATSGVNIDDEVIKMMGYQQAYIASAKYISTLSDLINVLVNINL
jgi:flagellar hook-associated protein 1